MQPVEDYEGIFGTFVAFDSDSKTVASLRKCRNEPDWMCIREETDYGLKFEDGLQGSREIKFIPCR